MERGEGTVVNPRLAPAAEPALAVLRKGKGGVPCPHFSLKLFNFSIGAFRFLIEN